MSSHVGSGSAERRQCGSPGSDQPLWTASPHCGPRFNVTVASHRGGLHGLTIESVETIAIRVPLSRRFVGSAYSMSSRCTIITRIRTSDGLVSAVYNGDTDALQPAILAIIHDELAPRITGLTAADPEACWRAMEPATNDILRDRSLALQAIACLDSAIWDLFGKSLELPLHRVWGSSRRTLPVSIIGGYYHLHGEEISRLLEQYRARGFGGCKFKVGGASARDDAARVELARLGAGREFPLMVDANQGYDRATAVEFGRRVSELDIRWFEEPCRWTNDRLWMRDVRMQTGIPVAAGQSETTLAGLRDLLVCSAIDVSNFDASWAGGPTIWRKAAGLCAAFGVEIGHHEEPQIAAHLLASVPQATFIECFDRERDPIFWNLTSNSTGIGSGIYELPTGAGFGIELDWDFVRRHTTQIRRTPA